MTHAICVRCGAMKFGCLLPCKTCGQTPRTARQIACSYFFSDHYNGPSELQEWSRQVLEERQVLPSFGLAGEAQLIAQMGHNRPPDDETEPDVISLPGD